MAADLRLGSSRSATVRKSQVEPGNRHDSVEALGLIGDIPPIGGRRGRPREKPRAAYGDRAYGTPRNRVGLQQRRIEDHLAAPGMPHGSGLGKVRWVVEGTLAWIGQARRLKVRYDVLPALHRAFHYLQMARICCLCLQRHF